MSCKLSTFLCPEYRLPGVPGFLKGDLVLQVLLLILSYKFTFQVIRHGHMTWPNFWPVSGQPTGNLFPVHNIFIYG